MNKVVDDDNLFNTLRSLTVAPTVFASQEKKDTLGTSSGVPGQDTANTSQGNGQCTHQKPVRYITNTFRIFQANLIAVFPAQEMASTSRVFPVM